jgi:hypothetical protein
MLTRRQSQGAKEKAFETALERFQNNSRLPRLVAFGAKL